MIKINLAAFAVVALLWPMAVAASTAAGEANFKAKNYAGAYLHLLPKAQAGDPQAQFLIGSLSDNGLGPVALNPHEAVKWYTRAAQKNHAEAQFALANAFASGRGVRVDAAKSLDWLRRSAENRHIPAMLSLAALLDDGRGVPADSVQATAWIRRAADSGDADAIYSLAERTEIGRGTKADKDAATMLMRQAAGLGHPAALYRLGLVGVALDATPAAQIEAFVWLSLAAQRGVGEVKRESEQARRTLQTQMAPVDVAAAQARVKSWKPGGSAIAEAPRATGG